MGSHPVTSAIAISEVLRKPRLARVYVYVLDNGPTTVSELQDELGLSRGTAYGDVERLQDLGLLSRVNSGQPAQYTAEEVEVTVVAGGDAVVLSEDLLRVIAGREDEYNLDMFAQKHPPADMADVVDTIANGGGVEDLVDDRGLHRVEAKAVYEAVTSILE